MRLYNQYSDNLLLQQNLDFVIRGESEGKVSAVLIDRTTNVSSYPKDISFQDGSFTVFFSGVRGSFDEYELVLSGDGQELRLKNVHFGDVLLLLGQSNMSYCLSALEKHDEYYEKIKKLEIYGLNIGEANLSDNPYETTRPVHPQKETDAKFRWTRYDSGNCPQVSGLSIMTSCLLAEKANYPIGFVHAAMGGLPIEAYFPKSEVVGRTKFIRMIPSYYETDEEYNTWGGRNYAQLGGVYNEKIAPLSGMHFRAFIWYLGESACYDFKRSEYFRKSLEIIISLYRRIFGQPDLPVLLTGIADDFYPYGDFMGYEYINEAQARMRKRNVTYIPIHDIEARWLDEANEDVYYHPIHPRNKEDVAKRYADVITGRVRYYPYVQKTRPENGSLILSIRSSSSFPVGSKFRGFTLAGEDNVYYPCTAEVTGGKEITLTSPFVRAPRYCTYAFTQYTYLCDAKNTKGQPLVPYRSKREPIAKGIYLTNALLLSCDYLKVRESTFGCELGGGFFTDVWKQSGIFHNPVAISLDRECFTEGDASVKIEAESDKAASYYYFAVSFLIGMSGFRHNLDKFRYLSLDLKGTSGTEFHGLLFRLNGMILRFPVIDEKGEILPYAPLCGEFRKITVDLTRCQDGSECTYESKAFSIENISEIDIYFRSKTRASVNIDNIVCANEVFSVGGMTNMKEEPADGSVLIMKK